MNVDAVFIELQRFQQIIRDFRQMVERVGKARDRRLIGIPKARMIWRDDVILGREFRNQIPKHVRRGREAVEQHDVWTRRITSLAVEEVQSVDLGGVISDARSFWRGLGFTSIAMTECDGGNDES